MGAETNGEICGDVPLSGAKRRRYLLRALGELRRALRAKADVKPWRLDVHTSESVEKISEGGSPWRIYSTDVLQQLLPRHLAKSRVVCDLGCGVGAHSRFLDPEQTYVGIDLIPHTSWYTRGGTPKRWFVQTTATGLGVGSAAADAVISSSTLEHVDDLSSAIEETARILRPGGYALHLLPGAWSAFLYGPHGYRRFGPQDAARFASSGHFEVSALWSLGGLGSFLLHLSWIAGIESGCILNWPLGLIGSSRTARGIGPRARRGLLLRVYRGLLRVALLTDRLLPQAPSGYALLLRRTSQ